MEGAGPYIFILPGSSVDQTKWLVFRMIHGSRIPDPTNRQSLVFGLPRYILCIFQVVKYTLYLLTWNDMKLWFPLFESSIIQDDNSFSIFHPGNQWRRGIPPYEPPRYK